MRAGKISERKAESYGMEGKLKKRAGAYFYDEKTRRDAKEVIG